MYPIFHIFFTLTKGVIAIELTVKICNILIAAIGALYAYQIIYVIIGLFFTKKFKQAVNYHKYAIIISARNEEKVIGNLLESIAKQDYPQNKLSVFVVADNCTDKTAQIARAHGAVCYERFDKSHCTKGYALQYLFQKIENDYGIKNFEAYVIFDADNLLKRDYIKRMNDAFDSGEKIITSYRNTKNLNSGFIAAGYALHWVRTCRFTSRARSFLGVSAWVQGCGFMFANELIKDGWNFTSLTEDRAFSISAVINGYKISYQHEAEFYDEQPTDIKIVMRQRIRWAKGHVGAFSEYWKKLIKGIFNQKKLIQKWNCYDMLVTMMPYSIPFVPLKLLKFVAETAIAFSVMLFGAQLPITIIKLVASVVFEHFCVIPMALLLFAMEYKRLTKIKPHKAVFYSLMFPLFDIIGDICTWLALFCKVAWKPIPHGENIKIDEIETKVTSRQKQ